MSLDVKFLLKIGALLKIFISLCVVVVFMPKGINYLQHISIHK